MPLEHKLRFADRKPLFVLSKLNRHTIEARSILRVIKYVDAKGSPVVRYDYCWYKLHPASELASLVRVKSRLPHQSFRIDGQDVGFGYVAKPFIKEWEQTLGAYEIYGY